jgi:hypothetical protein
VVNVVAGFPPELWSRILSPADFFREGSVELIPIFSGSFINFIYPHSISNALSKSFEGAVRYEISGAV